MFRPPASISLRRNATHKCGSRALYFLLAPGFWLLTPLLLLSGCVTVPPIGPAIAFTGDPVVDGKAQLDIAPAKDRVLWQYRIAAAALRRGQDAEARAQLDAARAAVAGLVSAPSAEAAQARGTFHAESDKPFVGEPYERVMANLYRALLYWREGEPDNARALMRDAELIDSDAENKTYSGDWVIPDWLDGFATTKLGGDGADALARARKNSAHPLPDYDRAANVLVLVEYGRGPLKVAAGEHGELLKFAADSTRAISARIEIAGQTVALPPWDDVTWQATTRGGRVMDHILGNKAVFKQAADTVGDAALLGAVIAAQNTRKEVKRTIIGPDGKPRTVTETVKDDDAANTALGLAAAGVLAKILAGAAQPAADTRAWDNLPQYLSLATLRLPPGDHSATLTFLDAAGQPLAKRAQTFTVTIPAEPENSAAAPAHDTVVFRSELPD
jgi:hypothetical protein